MRSRLLILLATGIVLSGTVCLLSRTGRSRSTSVSIGERTLHLSTQDGRVLLGWRYTSADWQARRPFSEYARAIGQVPSLKYGTIALIDLRWMHYRDWDSSGQLGIDTYDASMPAWVPASFLFLLLACILFWRPRRLLRRDQNRCLHCGYSLRGATSNICTECGTPFARPAPSQCLDVAAAHAESAEGTSVP